MNPSRPIDTNKPVVASGARAVAGAPAVPHVESAAESEPSDVGESETVVLSSAASAGREAMRLDAQRLASLKQAVADGSYHVDAQAMAKRIVEDALGPEVHE